MINDVFIFINIVQQQSLSKAAKKMGIPSATISRRLKHLEESVGNKLVHRSARQLTLTSQGTLFYNAYAHLVEQFETTQQQISSQINSLEGHLNVLAPASISTGILQPMWSNFIKTYPAIKLELNLSNQIENLLSSQADLALRIGPQASSSLHQKRLGTIKTQLVASPKYLASHKEPDTIDQLTEHKLIGNHIISDWKMQNVISGKRQELRPRFNTLINDIRLVTQLVNDGLGIALLPFSETQQYIEGGSLKVVLPNWQGPNRDIYAVWPSGKLLSKRAICLKDYMHQYLVGLLGE
ncbi:LysR family transcriptional regulator [Alteromonas sp. 5E99-2]|uniref:LysR family transcriptional regulator n=1 Tax=Alteromonas sp. 5E99-2 TaxID=2817683 RepID=UPI001A992430|nr:LysR family transcriptional regulator [Alteromonas sp. 5E99-2]MBO1256330.1 LysR family transcriptional regulator [Alteromonas sp. 5E99-2]